MAGDDAWGRPVSHGIGHYRRDPWLPRIPQSHWPRTTHPDEWEHIKGITFHDLRHDWAHRARAAGWLLEEIAVYAGHQTKDGAPAITTTVRYTLPSRQQLKKRLHDLSG